MDYKTFIEEFVDALRYNDWETLEYLEDEYQGNYYVLLEYFIAPMLSAACKTFIEE